MLGITIVLTLFAGRLVQLQGIDSAQLKQEANSEKFTKITLPAVRGTVYGSNGQVLAMTVSTYEIDADPPMITGDHLSMQTVAGELAGPLGMPAANVLSLLEHPPKISPEFVRLARDVIAQNEAKIAALDIPGLTMTPSFAEVYPNGDSTSDVVGLTNVDPSTGVINGYAGVEQQYNSLLTGTNGSELVETGLGGMGGQQIPMGGTQDDTPARNGESLKLTVNPVVQYQAQQACEQEVVKSKARTCSVVVMSPKTGAIIAMAQWPNKPGTDIPDENLFAPGSTAKVITAAAAFESSSVTPRTPYNIPPYIYKGGQSIHDAEWSPGERYTVAGIIANSSNIGMSQVVESVPEQVQYQYLKSFGLGSPTGLGLPGESPSVAYAPYALPAPAHWAGDERYTLSFGQGLSVNAVQMASVYATIANGGVRVQPTLVAGTYNAAGQYVPAAASPSKRVIQAGTAAELVKILQQVPAVDDQAGQHWGDIGGYAIAAKTGTASEPASASMPAPGGKSACPAGNLLCVHGSSYIGMAPGNDPGVVVAVNVQDPQTTTDYFGDEVAGPVFYSVMTSALQTLQIQPQPGLSAPYVRLNAP
jgi:cell division protein FtsI (penicillin-binding protein 3)